MNTRSSKKPKEQNRKKMTKQELQRQVTRAWTRAKLLGKATHQATERMNEAVFDMGCSFVLIGTFANPHVEENTSLFVKGMESAGVIVIPHPAFDQPNAFIVHPTSIGNE